MRDFREVHRYRERHPFLGWGDGDGGYFYIPEKKLTIIASRGAGWDHVSVSLEDRCPTWDEMEFVKRLFFKDDEVAYQLHPEVGKYKNLMPHCLHLWRPQQGLIPCPPSWMVAP